MKIKISYLAILLNSPLCLATPVQSHIDLSQTISESRRALASLPLDYALLNQQTFAGVVRQRYQLNSQQWSLQGIVSPARWQHEVDIYIPPSAREKNALLVINNGSNDDGSGHPVAASNFTQEQLTRIALATRTVVISVSNIPNQRLSFQGQTPPLAEDNSVAYSWRLFMADTAKHQRASLHIPMATSISQSVRLAKKELTEQKITQFIVTGASKRGWAAWLAALSDPDIAAIVPFAMDLLSTQKTLTHMYQTYGANWPIAFYPYYQQEIDKHINSAEFTALMTLEDPLRALSANTGQADIKKYIINASSDDFYVPDNSHFYYPELKGVKSLRVVPNATHNGILSVTEPALVTFVNRFQQQRKLPEITEQIETDSHKGRALTVRFSEPPSSILQWTANNPVARDFRYACDIKYHAAPVILPAAARQLTIPLTTPDNGWQATFIEATFSDGYIATTQAYITPDNYPAVAPPSKGAACQTLPGRGLTPAGNGKIR